MANCWRRLRGGSQVFLVREARHQLDRPSSGTNIGAHVGTVIPIQLPLFTRSGSDSTKVGLDPKYRSSSNTSDCASSRWFRRVLRVSPRRSTDSRTCEGEPQLPVKNSSCSAFGSPNLTVKATMYPARRM